MAQTHQEAVENKEYIGKRIFKETKLWFRIDNEISKRIIDNDKVYMFKHIMADIDKDAVGRIETNELMEIYGKEFTRARSECLYQETLYARGMMAKFKEGILKAESMLELLSDYEEMDSEAYMICSKEEYQKMKTEVEMKLDRVLRNKGYTLLK